jgi:thiamine pyrophosphokinase
LAEYIDIVEDVKIYDEYGIFTAIKKSTKFNSFAGQTVSVFSLTPDTEITYSGLEYPVEARRFTSWWQGTLNKSVGTEFEIKFDFGRLVVFQSFELL